MVNLLEIYREILASYDKYQELLVKQGKAIKNGEYEVVGECSSQIQNLQLYIKAQQQELSNRYKVLNLTLGDIKKYVTVEQNTKLEKYINDIDKILKKCTIENDNNQQLLNKQMTETGRKLININKGKKIAGVYTAKNQSAARIIDRSI